MKAELTKMPGVADRFTFTYPQSDRRTDHYVDECWINQRPLIINGKFYMPELGVEPEPGQIEIHVRPATGMDFYRVGKRIGARLGASTICNALTLLCALVLFVGAVAAGNHLAAGCLLVVIVQTAQLLYNALFEDRI